MNTPILRSSQPGCRPLVFCLAFLSASYRFIAKGQAAVIGLLTATLLSAALSAVQAQATAKLTTLYSFTDGDDGEIPQAALIQGSDGNFYGTTFGGGINRGGTVFRITPAGVLTTLHSFTLDSADGSVPTAALVQGSDGNFYGTTDGGGPDNSGTIFRITPAGAFTILYLFTGNTDGGSTVAALVQGRDGNFYGTTSENGVYSGGTVFRITPAGVLITLYSFTGGTDGHKPVAALIQGRDGNFYGTTSAGGTYGDGTVFQLTPAGVLTTLCNFTGGNDGQKPYAALIQGSNGDFYGTTVEGGADSVGTVFRITPTGALTTLHTFTGINDGGIPLAGLVEGSDGYFYGTTSNGGANEGGTIFQLTPACAFTLLHNFVGATDGEDSEATLIQGSDGNFYGTANGGGTSNDGTVFKLSVSGNHPAFFDGETALSDGVYYLSFSNGNYFGYYSFLSDPAYIYHFDLGYEYVFDAADGKSGVYLYDFTSSDFFYTSPTFPFPYLYDFGLNSVLYYYPDPNSAGHYNTDGIRYFYDFNTGTIISK